jgi:3'5'-cyclic nucleotide phosphodiesterase
VSDLAVNKMADKRHGGDVASPEAIEEMLTHICDWDFDVFRLARVTGGHALFHVGQTAFARLGLLEKFAIDAATLSNFLEKVEEGYSELQPYHNSTHAADVTQAMLFFLTTGEMARFLSDREVFSLIFAAIVHDIGVSPPPSTPLFFVRFRVWEFHALTRLLPPPFFLFFQVTEASAIRSRSRPTRRWPFATTTEARWRITTSPRASRLRSVTTH